ncbi:MAG TPA: hypothetical protein ENI26_05315 [Methylophaga aminisulfidivorans]|uniref:Uncharacterized protein n=2 Tax=root TaxID=1 RepID=A0A7C1W032_9GAMM|nr:hypothetical protein [Methylophaga sp.]HEC73777.1 hypothetical protein [Methylophaga aminisulfidivorans]
MTAKKTKKWLAENDNLTHATMQKVASHVQREEGEWILNTVTIEGQEVPYKYRRRKKYKSLKGARVDIVYYPEKEEIARMQFEYMKVVKIALS